VCILRKVIALMRIKKPPILRLLAILLSVALLDASWSTPAKTTDRSSLAGQLLVSSPTIGDPRFDHTVILVVQHDQKGAFGIAINLPLEERPLASLLETLGAKDVTAAGKVRIFAGGPVQPDTGFVIHSSDYRQPETVAIDSRTAMTSSRRILQDIGNYKGPEKYLVAFGYAGWGPGQLEAELERRVWFIAAADFKLIFDEDRDKVWESAYSHRETDL
jgi:putative transcriptional regulator